MRTKIYVRLDPKTNRWIATFTDPFVLEMFGTDTIPLDDSPDADPQEVVQRIAAANVAARVVLGPPEPEPLPDGQGEPDGKFVDKADVRLGLAVYEDLEELKKSLVGEWMRSANFPPEKMKELDDVIAAKKELLAKLP